MQQETRPLWLCLGLALPQLFNMTFRQEIALILCVKLGDFFFFVFLPFVSNTKMGGQASTEEVPKSEETMDSQTQSTKRKADTLGEAKTATDPLLQVFFLVGRRLSLKIRCEQLPRLSCSQRSALLFVFVVCCCFFCCCFCFLNSS